VKPLLEELFGNTITIMHETYQNPSEGLQVGNVSIFMENGEAGY
jgi:hypothetical protein